MDPAALVLEMTEGLFIDDSERAMTVLDDLKSLGVRLALDDFGTGYSGLSHLRQFAIDIVKLDQAVVAKVGTEPHGTQPNGTELIGALAHLAHVLGLTVAAEGVETEDQAADIAAAGCDIAQGFRYAHPMPGCRADGTARHACRATAAAAPPQRTAVLRRASAQVS